MLSGEFEWDTIDSENILRFDICICFLWVDDLIQSILHEAHSSRYSVHPSTTKMYRNLIQHYWWGRMKRYMVDFVAYFLCCQQVKADH